jgi:hypothetical protein
VGGGARGPRLREEKIGAGGPLGVVRVLELLRLLRRRLRGRPGQRDARTRDLRSRFKSLHPTLGGAS